MLKLMGMRDKAKVCWHIIVYSIVNVLFITIVSVVVYFVKLDNVEYVLLWLMLNIIGGEIMMMRLIVRYSFTKRTGFFINVLCFIIQFLIGVLNAFRRSISRKVIYATSVLPWI